jgi:undecaprenyl diphosphate synthase
MTVEGAALFTTFLLPSKQGYLILVLNYAIIYSMQNKLPKHIGIIMDGNRRWARDRGVTSLEGHKAGYEKVKRIAEACFDRGITMATFFAFSTENWDRPPEEVSYLMKLLALALRQEAAELHRKNIRLMVIGRPEGLPAEIRAGIAHAHELTKNNSRGTMVLAINYGGRAEIVDAVKKIITTGMKPVQVTEETVSHNLYSPFIPDPDLIIRTSGELRTSGFLLWESAYSELYFSKKYWPDFSEKDLDEAIEEYSRRQRRFGR